MNEWGPSSISISQIDTTHTTSTGSIGMFTNCWIGHACLRVMCLCLCMLSCVINRLATEQRSKLNPSFEENDAVYEL